jgi:hypothetical protein
MAAEIDKRKEPFLNFSQCRQINNKEKMIFYYNSNNHHHGNAATMAIRGRPARADAVLVFYTARCFL